MTTALAPIDMLEANRYESTSRLTTERRIELGKQGLSGMEVQMVVRAQAMAGEMVSVLDIRNMNLDEVMELVAYTPKIPAIQVAQALGLDIIPAGRLFDACLAIAERRRALSMVPDPEARAIGGVA